MATTDSLPVPRKNVAFRAHFDLRLNTGALNSGAAGLDSEVSKDDGTMTDCTNEATEIATSSGHYYLDLTSTEMNADSVVVQIKSSTSLAVTRTLIMHPQETGDIKVDVTSWLGTATPAPGTAGVPSVDTLRVGGTVQTARDLGASVLLSSGTGTGQLSFTSGIASVNATQLNSDATAAANLSTAALAMVTGTVDTAGFSPTTTEFETSSITTAATSHWVGRIVIFTSGTLIRQQGLITAYSLVSGRGHFTVSTLTSAPANAVTFIIV